MIRMFACAALAVATFASAAPAFAHVTLEVPQAAIGSTYKAVLRVPHGCGTEATTHRPREIPRGSSPSSRCPRPAGRSRPSPGLRAAL